MIPLDPPDAPIPGASAALAALRTPMAVISGRAQLLRRRIRRGRAVPMPDLLETLATIERSVAIMEAQLRALQDAAYRTRDGGE
jgi:signal transduction histidine kinase